MCYGNRPAALDLFPENRNYRTIASEHISETYRNKFVRDGANIKCSVDGKQGIDLTIEDEEILNNLNQQPRLKFYGWRGGTYEISNAVLTDGKE